VLKNPPARVFERGGWVVVMVRWPVKGKLTRLAFASEEGGCRGREERGPSFGPVGVSYK
jgi:hypothetical protein